LHKLINRKAGAPIHVKIGQPGEAVQKEDIDAMADKLKFMNNRTEWPTDGSVDMKVIDFGDVGKNLTDTLEHDVQMLLYGIQIPSVLMGTGNIPEGLAKVQLEAFQRKVRSIQEQIESIIEEKIFKQLLNANGLDGSVDFTWNLPGEEEINQRIEKVTKLLESFTISENMRRQLELELARLLNFDDLIDLLRKPEPGLDDKKEAEKKAEKEELGALKKSPEREKEENIKQPEVPGAKPKAKLKGKVKIQERMRGEGCGQQLTEAETANMNLKEWTNLQEIAGFNYTDYIVKILQELQIDKFEQLAAMSRDDVLVGLLPPTDIEKLRIILRDGFRKNKTIRQIENEIRDNIKLKDRIKDGKVTAKAENRPNMIARTETVRLANRGLVEEYKSHNIKKVRWLAALSERTCPICEDLNGQVFNLGEMVPPAHTSCRCALTPVI